MPAQPEFDVVAIGGGTAGLVTAAGVAGLGARAALIERERLGGDCLWTGCVPSKALISSARLANGFREAARFGLTASDPAIDGGSVMSSVRDVREVIAPHDDPERFRAMGVDVIEGSARFVSPHEVQVGDRRVTGRRFVIATGTRAAVPPIPGLDETGYFTHAEAFERTDLPRSLAVIGGGAIGVELAQSFRRLGVDVTIVEMMDRLLIREEPELADRLTRSLEDEGVRVITGRVVTRVESSGSGARLYIEVPGSASARGESVPDGDSPDPGQHVEADEILVAVGRRPNTEDLGLEEAGVATDRGWVTVDAKLRTSQRHIFGAGDVTGGYLFTHVADHEARTVVQNALLPVRAKIDYRVIPWCTYTEPELAHVGLTEAEARERHGDSVTSHVYDLSGLDRAIAERAASGCVKVVVGKGGRILGGHILGPSAGTMIAEIALAMKHGIAIGSLSSLVHPYPTMSEGVRRVADTYRRSLLTGWRKTLLDVAIKAGRAFPA
ncbi:MAG: mercuric reductase [Gemmatimonadota bacterium]|nr:mercuric reductase [Gemmatimonadota bacterium]